jgi:hypothetical protein
MNYLKNNWESLVVPMWRLGVIAILSMMLISITATYDLVDGISHTANNTTVIEHKLDQIYTKVSEQPKPEPQAQQSCPEPKDSFYQHAEDIKNFVEVLDPVFLQHPTMIQIVELLSLSEGKVDPNVFKSIIPVP